MDINIKVAIIAGLFVVAVPVISQLMKRYFDNRDKSRTSRGRRNALTGRWRGKMILNSPDKRMPDNLPVKVEFSTQRHDLNGKANMEYEYNGNKIINELELVGNFYYERFLVIDYKNIIPTKIQFGSCLLELSSSAHALTGRFVGFATGSDNQGISDGKIFLQKFSTD